MRLHRAELDKIDVVLITDSGRAAGICSLLGTAKLNDIEPEGHLRHVLERINEHPINKIEELLSWNAATQIALIARLAA